MERLDKAVRININDMKKYSEQRTTDIKSHKVTNSALLMAKAGP